MIYAMTKIRSSSFFLILLEIVCLSGCSRQIPLMRRPAGPPDCAYIKAFEYNPPRANVDQMREYMLKELDGRYFLILKDSLSPGRDYAFIQTDYTNVGRALGARKSKIIEMALQISLTARGQAVHMDVQMSVGEAGTHDSAWTCKFTDNTRDLIAHYWNEWQGRFHDRWGR
jgi:hypothetical protein